ncbi:hypothetical protein [Rhizobium sp. NFR07]|uniref:hypothetical protein n=1 Tax=Rhizobium sp. NFR07 TaxID=1566262 RepID=UPI000B85BBE6|nr:hypothetical protein [Rhizobium sp. NFR07]
MLVSIQGIETDEDGFSFTLPCPGRRASAEYGNIRAFLVKASVAGCSDISSIGSAMADGLRRLYAFRLLPGHSCRICVEFSHSRVNSPLMLK